MRFIYISAIILLGYCTVFIFFPHQGLNAYSDSSVLVCDTDMNSEEPMINRSSEGGKLFRENCARCHSTKLKKESVGPALWGVQDRIPEEKLIAWISNSFKVLETGDPYFHKLWNKYNRAVMDPMPHLKREDIEAILDEIREQSK